MLIKTTFKSQRNRFPERLEVKAAFENPASVMLVRDGDLHENFSVRRAEWETIHAARAYLVGYN